MTKHYVSLTITLFVLSIAFFVSALFLEHSSQNMQAKLDSSCIAWVICSDMQLGDSGIIVSRDNVQILATMSHSLSLHVGAMSLVCFVVALFFIFRFALVGVGVGYAKDIDYNL